MESWSCTTGIQLVGREIVDVNSLSSRASPGGVVPKLKSLPTETSSSVVSPRVPVGSTLKSSGDMPEYGCRSSVLSIGPGCSAMAPEASSEIGDSFAVRSPMAPSDSESESAGQHEVRFEGTNPTCCSSSGRSETAPELKTRYSLECVCVHRRDATQVLPDQSEKWMSPSALSSFRLFCYTGTETQVPQGA